MDDTPRYSAYTLARMAEASSPDGRAPVTVTTAETRPGRVYVDADANSPVLFGRADVLHYEEYWAGQGATPGGRYEDLGDAS